MKPLIPKDSSPYYFNGKGRKTVLWGLRRAQTARN